MQFLLDANLVPALAARIAGAGYECVHVGSILPATAKDREIAELANRLGFVLIMKDADFADLKRRGKLLGPLVWLKSGNMSNRLTGRLLLPRMPEIIAAISSGEAIIEIR